jgi:hypothetical protein
MNEAIASLVADLRQFVWMRSYQRVPRFGGLVATVRFISGLPPASTPKNSGRYCHSDMYPPICRPRTFRERR